MTGCLCIASLTAYLLAACTGTPAPATQRTGSAASPGATAVPSTPIAQPPAAAPPKPIVVGMSSVGITYLQHHIAQRQGFFQQVGFDAQIQIIPQNALLTGIVAGEINYGDSGGSAVRAAASGLPVRLVSCHGTRPLYMLVLAPGPQAASELNGKAVSINALGSDTHIIGRDLIRRYGGDPDRVEYFPLGASSVRYAAVESGRVAGGIVTVTEAVLARQAGLAVVSTVSDLPLACNAGTVISLATLGERRDEVQRFLQAITRAVTFMQSQRADTAKMLADWVGIDQREAEQTYDEAQMQLSWSNEKGAAQQAIETAIAFAKEGGQIPDQVQLIDVADLSLYP